MSPASGKVVEWLLHENKTIAKNTLVAKIESPLLKKKLEYNRRQQEDVQKYIQDLHTLVKLDSLSIFNTKHALGSTVFKSSLVAFRQELQSESMKIQNIHKVYRRQLYLYEKGVVSSTDLEESEYKLNSVRNRFRLLLDQQRSKWEAELLGYRQKLDELEAEALQLLEEQHQYNIHMPVSGTVQNLAGISTGSYVHINQRLADISPDTGLVAECYVSPEGVGLLKEGMAVRFQVDAFNYNQWGTLTGTVTDVSNDAIMIEKQPYFSVRSVLNEHYLELPNGYKGYLKKGMTLQGRFKITERSLFQLLYDNVDDWLNPTQDD